MSPRSKRMGVAVAALGLLALLAWAFSPQPIAVETAAVVQRDFELTLDEEASTRLTERHLVSSPLSGRLARIALREGDAVRAGDLLATLQPLLAPMLDERSQQEAAARTQGALAQLHATQARVARARLGVEQARTEVRRSEPLAREGFIASTKLDIDRLALRAAQQELEIAIQQADVARHELDQARAVLGVLRQGGSGHFAVRAPIDGQVLRVLLSSEGTVQAGAPLLELGDLERLEVVAPLLTGDALRAPAGTPVRIERTGLAGSDGRERVLEGVVARIEPAAFTKVSALGVEEQRVNARIRITSPRDQWRPLGDGFRVWVRLVLLRQREALCAPASALFPHGEGGGMAVFRLEDGRATLTPVQVRARNADWAWIERGVALGDALIVYPAATLKDGGKVTVQRGS